MTQQVASKIEQIKLTEIIVDNSFNVRGAMSAMDVVDLAKSIEELGLMQPVMLSRLNIVDAEANKPYKYKLIAGFRRQLAHKVLKRETIPAIIRDDISDIDARILNLSENLDRHQLNIMQEANGVKSLMDAGMSYEEVLIRTRQSRGWLQVRQMLLQLPPEVQGEAAAGVLSQQNVRDIYTHRHDLDRMYEVIQTIKTRKEKGEKAVRIRPPETAHVKRKRSGLEVTNALNHIMNSIGPCAASVAMAWVAGNVTDYDLYVALQDHALKHGTLNNGNVYDIPRESLSNMVS